MVESPIHWIYFGRGQRQTDRYTRGSHATHTSLAVIVNASQSTLGRRFDRKEGLYSMSDCSSSASLKWRGKERGEVLHALTAQVRKFTVSIFMSNFLYCPKIKADTMSSGRVVLLKRMTFWETFDHILSTSWADLATKILCFTHPLYTIYL